MYRVGTIGAIGDPPEGWLIPGFVPNLPGFPPNVVPHLPGVVSPPPDPTYDAVPLVLAGVGGVVVGALGLWLLSR